MGVRSLTSYVLSNNLWRPQNIRDCSLVIDGSSFTAWAYRQSRTEAAFGGDYDVFAKYLQNLFDQFKKCNITCYIVFGGHSGSPILIERMPERIKTAASLRPRACDVEITTPLLTWISFKMILKDNNIPFITTTSECESDIIDLARHFGCPILSNDSDFFLSDLPVVTLNDFNFENETSSFKINLYNLELLLQKFGTPKEMMPIFSLLLQYNYLEGDYFKDFMANILKINPTKFYPRIDAVLKWMSQHSYDSALDIVFRYVPQRDRNKCRDILENSKICLGIREATSNFIVPLFTDTEDFINMQDNWYIKGVLAECIDEEYHYIYSQKRYFLYAQVENYNEKDSFNISLRILWYAFDLLTNFKNDHFYYISREGKRLRRYMIKKSEYSTAIPEFYTGENPFENGWDNVSGYFEHFLRENLPGLPFTAIMKLPSDCQLFMIALLWFNHYSQSEHKQVVYSVLMSYLWINVVCVKMQMEDANDMRCTISKEEQAGDDSGEDLFFKKYLVTRSDCEIATEVLNEHYPREETEPYSDPIHFDITVIHALAQFQGCLNQLYSLNKLCGSMYEGTKYHKVYNGSFICSVYCKMKESGDSGSYMQERLAGAGSVGKFFKSLCDVFEECADGIRSAHG